MSEIIRRRQKLRQQRFLPGQEQANLFEGQAAADTVPPAAPAAPVVPPRRSFAPRPPGEMPSSSQQPAGGVSTEISPEDRDALLEIGRQRSGQGAFQGPPPSIPWGEPAEGFGRASREAMGEGLEDIDRRRQKLEGWRSIAEGLGNIDLVSPGGILLRSQGRQQPFKAEGIRGDLERLEDEMTPQDRAFVKQQLGVDVPEGARWSRTREVLPQVTSLLREKAREPYRDETLGLQRRRADISEGHLGLREKELEQAEGRLGLSETREERMGEAHRRVPEVEMRSLTSIDTAKTTIDQVMQEAGDAQFGPIAGRAQLLFRKIGLADPETIGTAARLADAINKYIYASTGKQLNQFEMQRLEAQLPQVWDSPDAFQSIGRVFKEQLDLVRDNTLKGLEKNKYDTSAWRDETQAEGAAAETGQTTQKTKRYRIPASDLEAIRIAKMRGLNYEVVP